MTTKTFKSTFSLVALTALASLTIGCAEADDLVGNSEDGVAGRASFDVFKGVDGRSYFNFSAANHEIILASQGYQTRTGALAGVLAVLDNAVDADAFDIKPAKSGGTYFNVVAGNGEIIATSEVYSTSSSARRGVETVIRNIAQYRNFTATRTGARFVVFASENGSFFYQLRAKNGQVVLHSEAYRTEAAALNGTFSVANFGVTESNFEILEAANGGFYFNLIASNGQIIGTSEIYSTKSNATRGRNAVVELLPQVDLL